MSYKFENDRPIYIQIVDEIRMKIISNEYKPGSKIPSVRDLAVTYKVNPNTMQKALSELEIEKLITTERTNGKFVTEDDALIKKMREEYAKDITKKYYSEIKKMGMTIEESIKYLQNMEENR